MDETHVRTWYRVFGSIMMLCLTEWFKSGFSPRLAIAILWLAISPSVTMS